MALSGSQITSNRPGGAGRAYAGFTAKATTIISFTPRQYNVSWFAVHRYLGIRA